MVRPGQAVWTGSLGVKSGTTGAMRLSDELDGWLGAMATRRSGVSSTCSRSGASSVLFLFLLAPSALREGHEDEVVGAWPNGIGRRIASSRDERSSGRVRTRRVGASSAPVHHER